MSLRLRHRAVVAAVSLAVLPFPLLAQTARDSLAAGRRAYETVDYSAAVRLLPVGLVAAGARDTAWSAGVHMLTDALIEQGADSLARLWARWAWRTAPSFAIDSAAFPPRVIAVLSAARTAVGPIPAGDSLAPTTFEPAGGRGQLRIARVSGVAFAVIEGVGTILPGESRSLSPHTYAIRITADGFPPIVAVREVLPGFATVITPRLVRQVAVTPQAAPSAAPAASPAPPVRGSVLSAAGANICAVQGSQLYCWGDNTFAQLGGGFIDTTVHAPVAVPGDDSFRAVSVGATHACGLTTSGKAYCWGLGTSGELGGGRPLSSASPAPVAGGQAFLQIASGGTHTCGLTLAGTVLCWGANTGGQLGNRTNAPSAAPVAVALPATITVTAISVGGSHACALASTGSAWCWGGNGAGQLGNGSTSDASAPVAVPAPVPFRLVRAGGAHTCALATTGAAYCWGTNTSGQAGTGQAGASELRPVAVTGGLSFDSLDTGEAHTCGRTTDGAAYCWGMNRYGQLGNGQTSDSPRPALVVGGHVFRALALAATSSCGLDTDGVIRCWGSNAQGQLGSFGGRSSAIAAPVLLRPTAWTATSGLFVIASLRERFDDGNFSAGPAWLADSASGARLGVVNGVLEISRHAARPISQGADITLPVHVPVSRATQIQFDVQVLPDSARRGCGLNCASWPARVRLRVRNSDLTESEVWYGYSDIGGTSHTLGNVVIVGRGDAPAGEWLREQRFTVRDALPRADTIIQISVGGTGTDYAARFDNIYLPVPVLASVDVKPDSLVLLSTAPSPPLRATAKDDANAELPWVRVQWSSGDTTIARVDSLGAVTAAKTGRAWVRGMAGTVGDSTKVIVRLAPPARTPGRRQHRP